MAVVLQTATSFRISRSLFRNDDGSPIVFCSEFPSDDLKSIIHKGGGYLIDDPAEAKILLCEKRTDNKISNGYLPVDFIVDCVKRNSFLNVDNYRAEHLGLRASTSNCEGSAVGTYSSDEEEHMVKISGSSRISVKASSLLGRKKYSDLEDMKIIQHLINHNKYSETGGNLVWKQMELVKVTDHTYQSMKARFQKKILPEIDTYNIPADWKEKLCGDYCTATNEKAKGLNGHVKSFDDIDSWKNEEKRLRVNSKMPVKGGKSRRELEPCDDSSAKNSSISNEIPATSSLHDQHSRVVIESSVINAADSIVQVSENLTKDTNDKIDPAVLQVIQTENCDPASAEIDIHKHPSARQISDSLEPVAETQSCDYSYDELDCLILSEANRSKGLDDPDKSHKQSNINNAPFTTRKRASNIINCDDCSPKKLINLRTRSFAIKEEDEIQNGNIVEDNSHDKSTKLSSTLRGKRKSKNRGSVSKQQIVSDGQVDEVSERYTNSLSKIVTIIEKGSFNSTAKEKIVTLTDSNLKLTNNELDTHQLHKLTPAKESSKNIKIRTVSPKVQFPAAQTIVAHQDNASVLDKSNSGTSCQNLLLVTEAESMESQRNVRSKLQSKSTGPVREHISDEHTNTVINFSKTKPSSETIKKDARSNDLSSEESGVEWDSSHKRIKKQASRAAPAVKESAVNRTCPVLTNEGQDITPVKDLPWCSKESTVRKVKFLSEEYGLDLEEAVNLLWMHNGSFLSVIQYFES